MPAPCTTDNSSPVVQMSWQQTHRQRSSKQQPQPAPGPLGCTCGPGSSTELSVFERRGGLLVGVANSGAGPLDEGAIDQAQGHLEALAGEYGSTRIQLVLVDTSAGSQRFLEGQAAGLLCLADVLSAGCTSTTLAVAAYSEALVPASPHIFKRQVALQGVAE